MESSVKWRLGLLSSSHLVNDFLNGILVSILPFLQTVYQLSYTQLTALVFISNVFAFLIQPALGYLADKRERPWMLPISTLLLGGGYYAMTWSGSYWWLVLTVILSALGSSAYHPDANRTVFLLSPQKRGLAQSIFQIGGNTGMALAPITLWFLNRQGLGGMVWFLVIALVMGAIMFVFARGSSLQRRKTGSKPVGAAKSQMAAAAEQQAAPQQAPRGGIVVLTAVASCRALATLGITTFLPLYLIHSYGYTKDDVWIYSFLFLIGGALGTFTGGPLGDRFGKKPVMQMSFFASIPLAFLLPFMHGAWMMILLFVLGFVLLSTFAVAVVYAQELMPKRAGMASSLVVGVTGGLSGIVVLVLGFFADSAGLLQVLWAVLSMPLLGALLSLWLPKEAKEWQAAK